MSVLLTREDGLSLTFDGYESIDYEPRVDVTQEPVEIGADVSDHAHERPLRFTVRGAVLTETPRIVPKQPGGIAFALTFFETAAGKTMTVTTPDGVYLTCLLEGWANRKTRRGDRRWDVAIRQIRIATGVGVTIPARTPAPVAAVGAPDAVDVGAQPTLPVSEAASTSALAAASDLLFGSS